MDKEFAIAILKAVACCSTRELSCYDCPLWDNKTSKCRPWTDDEVTEAVHTLNGEMICKKVIEVCPEFKDELVPMCVRNGGVCYEMFPCGGKANETD